MNCEYSDFMIVGNSFGEACKIYSDLRLFITNVLALLIWVSILWIWTISLAFSHNSEWVAAFPSHPKVQGIWTPTSPSLPVGYATYSPEKCTCVLFHYIIRGTLVLLVDCLIHPSPSHTLCFIFLSLHSSRLDLEENLHALRKWLMSLYLTETLSPSEKTFQVPTVSKNLLLAVSFCAQNTGWSWWSATTFW